MGSDGEQNDDPEQFGDNVPPKSTTSVENRLHQDNNDYEDRKRRSSQLEEEILAGRVSLDKIGWTVIKEINPEELQKMREELTKQIEKINEESRVKFENLEKKLTETTEGAQLISGVEQNSTNFDDIDKLIRDLFSEVKILQEKGK